MYVELTSTAKEDNPQPAVEQFLDLHASLVKTAVTSRDQSPGGDPIPEEALKISADKRRRASSWVHAALATDLSSFSLYHRKPHISPLPAAPAAVAVVLDVPPGSGSSKPSPLATPRGKARGVAAKPKEWARGGGLEEGAELARALREETRGWFLGFAERFLDADVATAGPSDREQVAGMLSQLKRVNDWLEGEDGCGKGEGVPAETIERLRKKIYEYLLAHVESAAVALGGGSPAMAAEVGGERPCRKG